MGSPPAPRTWVDGDIPPYSTLNVDLYNTWVFLLNPPMVKARQTTSQSIASGSYLTLNFQIEDVDTHGFHNSTYPSRFTPPIAGYYIGYYGWSFKPLNTVADTTGRRIGLVRMNGSATYFRGDINHTYVQNYNLVVKGNQWGPLYFNGTTDYIEVQVYQNSGSALSTDVGAGTTDYEEQPEFYMRWWGKQ